MESKLNLMNLTMTSNLNMMKSKQNRLNLNMTNVNLNIMISNLNLTKSNLDKITFKLSEYYEPIRIL